MWLSQGSRQLVSATVRRVVPIGHEFAAIAADHIPVAGQS